MPNQELARELHKPIIRKFNDHADHAYMQLIRKFDKEFWSFLCVIDIYSKPA